MRIIRQQDHGRLDVVNEWLRRGCPEKFLVHYQGKDYNIENGMLVINNYSGPVRDKSRVALTAPKNVTLMRSSEAENRPGRVGQPVALISRT